MLILSEEYQATDGFPPFIWTRVQRKPPTTIVRLFGRLTAYLPHAGRPHYTWAVVVSYTPGKEVSTYELRPPLLQVKLFSRWELGLVLGHWLLGLRLRQPLVWMRRLRPA